jgi:hypothetical protein
MCTEAITAEVQRRHIYTYISLRCSHLRVGDFVSGSQAVLDPRAELKASLFHLA